METKNCNCCKKDYPIEKFAFKNRALGKRVTFCDECRREKSKKTYYKHHETNLKRAKKNKKINKDWYQELKKTLSCCVCGENEPSCLDFHHIDESEKDFNIANRSTDSKQKLKEELNKCACLCANCHRKHHAGKLNATLVKMDII